MSATTARSAVPRCRRRFDPERRRSFAKPIKLARISPRSSPRQHQQNDREKRPHAAEAEQSG